MLTLRDTGERHTGTLCTKFATFLQSKIISKLKIYLKNIKFGNLATRNIFLIVLNKNLGDGSFFFFYLANRKQMGNIV